MARRRRQFTIGSLMVVIAIVALCLAVPAIPLAFLALLILCIPAVLLCIVLPVVFLIFLFIPLLLLDWLGRWDQAQEERKRLRDSPSSLVVVAGDERSVEVKP